MKTQVVQVKTQFQRGPYGEILPPPLVGGLSEDEVLNRLVFASRREGETIETVPTRGQSRKGMLNLGMLYVHQFNLASAIAGRLDEDPDASMLRKAVIEDMAPMSLRPLGMENLWFSSFAPVLRLVDPDKATWQMGLPSKGRFTTFHSSADKAVRHAQKLYVEWSEQDRTRFQGWLLQAAKTVEPHYQHLVWQAALTKSSNLTTRLAKGYLLERLGKHSTYRIFMPEGERVFETGRPERAIKMASAILAKNKVAMPHYLPGQVVGALVRMGGIRPKLDGARWGLGDYTAKFVNRQVIGISRGKKRYGLTRQSNVFRIGEVSGNNRIGKTLGSLLVPAVWTKEEKTRVGLTWATWLIGGVR